MPGETKLSPETWEKLIELYALLGELIDKVVKEAEDEIRIQSVETDHND